MFRYLVLPTLVALLLIPDWASAFFRRKSATCPVVPAKKVQYACAPVYSAPPCPPIFTAPLVCCPSTTIVPATQQAAPQVVPERMATPKAATPAVTAPVVKPEKLVEPKPPTLIPNQDSKLLPEPSPVKPVVAAETIKPVVASDEKLPPIAVPLTPSPAPALPKLSLEPIPAKDATLEEKPAPVKPDSSLPKLELPSLDLPTAPRMAIPKEVEVKSSPINTEKQAGDYEVYPIDGNVPASPDEKRIVTFYNFTGRDLLLTIDGKAYTLPAKHTVEGKLGIQFKMQVGIAEEHEMTVPMSAAGVDVVFKK